MESGASDIVREQGASEDPKLVAKPTQPKTDSSSCFGIYAHIPFCTRKCPYCHFFVLPEDEKAKDTLLRGLLLELEMRKDSLRGQTIPSVYFGGGTPSLFGPKRLEAFLSKLSLPPDCEITLEVNPENVTLELMRAFREVGINRISLGVQSLHDPSLVLLERTHSSNKAVEAIETTHAAGFDNITIDLMYELPDQKAASFEKTLEQLQGLPITHLSLYNLTIEPNTPFYKRDLNLPTQEEGLKMLEMAVHHLEAIGLKRYEISAFAKNGYQAIHNTGYWKARPFFGLGPSAFSYYGGARFRNVPHLKRYMEALEEVRFPIDFEEKLPYPQNVHELLAVRLRLLEGVVLDDIELPERTRMKVKELAEEGFLEEKRGRVCLSQKGLLFYDSVASELI